MSCFRPIPRLVSPNLQGQTINRSTLSTFRVGVVPRPLPLRVIRSNTRRDHTSSSSSSLIDEWSCKLTTGAPKFTYDTVDVDRISQLRRILPTRQQQQQQQSSLYLEDLKEDEDLDPSFHLVLFRPKPMLRDLGSDGTSTEYNAPPPYTRRMWAGGSIEWSALNRSLRVGEKVTQIVNVPKVEFKMDMVFVNQQLRIYPGTLSDLGGFDEESWSIREIRTHVFRKGPTTTTTTSTPVRPASTPSEDRDSIVSSDNSDVTFTHTPSSPLLFFYSALTYNPHKVHYDHPWTINQEGHPRPLVHGPLTATLLVELANLNKPSGKRLKMFRYRATSPRIIDDEIKLIGNTTENGEGMELMAVQNGNIGMKAAMEYQ
ncbi:hypothetical protein I204_07489 [Kwoniella mangroviensis CBS 8886]|nr:hypothetical protein I204_07489 [Kwoniella mangroviensis CBS 8886]